MFYIFSISSVFDSYNLPSSKIFAFLRLYIYPSLINDIGFYFFRLDFLSAQLFLISVFKFFSDILLNFRISTDLRVVELWIINTPSLIYFVDLSLEMSLSARKVCGLKYLFTVIVYWQNLYPANTLWNFNAECYHCWMALRKLPAILMLNLNIFMLYISFVLKNNTFVLHFCLGEKNNIL